MSKTVTCLYPSNAEASSIVRQLEQAGISEGKICMFNNAGNNRLWESASSFDDAGATGDDRVSRYLQNNGVPSTDAHAYAEGVRRGHALVAVRCDDHEVDRVVSILDSDDVIDIDERQEAWQSEGWKGHSMRQNGDEVIPVAEEELHVGKREVSHGRIRIRSHVVERPVQEQVSLTEERVAVERRPVNESMHRSTTGDNSDLFRERTVEMEERAEEAVVSKGARVVEEVVVRKQADQHTETVSDTVRKTEVEVDDDRPNTVPGTGTKGGTR